MSTLTLRPVFLQETIGTTVGALLSAYTAISKRYGQPPRRFYLCCAYDWGKPTEYDRVAIGAQAQIAGKLVVMQVTH